MTIVPVVDTDIDSTFDAANNAVEYGAANITLTILAGALVRSGAQSGVFSDTSGSTLINNGNIVSDDDVAVFFESDDGVIVNNAGRNIIGGTDGIVLNSSDPTITNHGKVIGLQSDGIAFAASSSGSELNNTGEVYGQDSGVHAVFSLSSTIVDAGTINNSGLIHSDGVGVLSSTGHFSLLTINNEAGGTIMGTVAAIQNSAGRLSVTNHGTLTGNVDCNSATGNTIVNFGTIDGEVQLGGGNDVFTSVGGTSGKVFGENGADIFTSGSKIDQFDGGNDADTFRIAGSAGIGDSFDGGDGTDTLQVLGSGVARLAAFDATGSSIEIWQGNGAGLHGTKGANTFDFSGLTSKTGLPFVDGRGGNDSIIGSDFADTLAGGRGTDMLTGNSGGDLFDFNSIKDSMPGAKRDKILDFDRSEADRIDLRDIDAKKGLPGNQKFTWIGERDFHDAKGELRYEVKGNKVIVQGDVNGDGKADFEILVLAGSLIKGDFLL
ncbi:MAG: hypothetical protein ACRECX_12475 [Methyloceanibacter sp.]|uniref:hypothetical protein n=1 Tax=Methyloceanibacter sp. TaxID=1965321 RepID=UPI003D6D5117